MRKDIHHRAKDCLTCVTRGTGRAMRSPLSPILVGGPFKRVGLDVVQFPLSRQDNKYAIVFTDYSTKCVEVFPSPHQSTLTITRLLMEVISRHGVPKELALLG